MYKHRLYQLRMMQILKSSYVISVALLKHQVAFDLQSATGAMIEAFIVCSVAFNPDTLDRIQRQPSSISR